ncbi:hypothetical protein BH11PSE11_BH11PSE11_15740 [soil metagenome]
MIKNALLCCVAVSMFASTAQAATPMIALGVDHAVALRSDGTVVTWGADQNGQLGSGRSLEAKIAVTVPGLSPVKSIATGLNHSIAITQDGAVWTWGMNYHGQLGNGTTTDSSAPVRIQGISNAASACGGDSHTTVVKQDGTVWSWGAGYYGELANGVESESLTPLQVAGLTGVVAVACGHNHIVALRQDGTVRAWGLNTNGELGDGSTTHRFQPVVVTGLSNVTSIVAGNGFSAALKQDGTVWEWGIDWTYVTPARPLRLTPVQTAGISGAISLGATNNQSTMSAVGADGVAWWTWYAGTPPALQLPAGNLQKVVPADSHTLMLKADRSVLAFGDNSFGQIGDGTLIYRNEPVPVTGLSDIVAIAPSTQFSIALDASGRVWAWGTDTYGQLGRGSVLSRSIPATVAGLSGIVQVSTSGNHNLALDQGGKVWAWGEGGYSQLGDGTYYSRSAPILLDGISDVQAVAAGYFHSMALKRDGTVWTWGNGSYGQIGNGTDDNSEKPVQVAGLSGVKAIAAASHNLVLKLDGTVWAWGANDDGALGIGTAVNSNVPVQVPGLSGVKAIAATRYRSFALNADGTAKGWGNNFASELGDGTTINRPSPVSVTGLSGAVEIAAGIQHTLARKADGSIWGWGYDSQGELHYQDGYSATTPVPIPGVDSVAQIAAGSLITGMLRSDGLVYMGGKNSGGQLGDGTFALHKAFVLAVNPGANGFLNLAGGSTAAPAGLNVPFFVVATGGISNNSATVKTSTRFNAVDSGKSGSVFITAKVPSGSLAAPDANPKFAKDDSGYVLVQLTESGWQQVVDGQLVPYASGVLGEVLASQTILNNTDTSKLKGAQFCVGYGTSAAEMVAGGRMLPVASIPNPAAGPGAPVSTCTIAGSPAASVAPLTGLWWNAEESGWGISLTQQASTIFVTWYTYDQAGNPSWFVMSNCALSGSTCTGDIYSVAGGTQLTVPWNGAGKVVTRAGSGTISFAGYDNASFSYIINGVNGSRNITRQLFATGSAQPTIDYSALWWNPNESGWGIALTQQFGMIFATMYTYDANGNPLWYVASSCPVSGKTCSGDLYRVNGGTVPTLTWNGAAKLVTKVGTTTFNFSDASNGTMNFTINGVSSSKLITRQLF